MTTAELRWILLGICLVLYGALVWWERRRPRQASGSAGTERSAAPREFSAEASLHVRTEPALTLPTMRAREPGPPHELPVVEAGSARSHAGAQEEPAGDSPTDEVAALAGAASAAPAVVEETFEYVPKAERRPRGRAVRRRRHRARRYRSCRQRRPRRSSGRRMTSGRSWPCA